MKSIFHSNGKLLITAEFLVIDGAKALALPSRFGQSLSVEKYEKPKILWKSFTNDDKCWYQGEFGIQNHKIISFNNTDSKTTNRLLQIFEVLQNLNPSLFKNEGYLMESYLEFPQDWGLGSSSTLLNNLAEWAQVNPFVLSNQTFGGSAYDIACAQYKNPIIYQRTNPEKPLIKTVNFNPKFKDKIFFVHRNQKQNTRTVVAHYKNINPLMKATWIKAANILTDQFLNCQDITSFETLIDMHEDLLSEVLALRPVKKTHFPDYPYAIKSLGAWGGDFMMVVGEEQDKDYFIKKGYQTILNYDDMVY